MTNLLDAYVKETLYKGLDGARYTIFQHIVLKIDGEDLPLIDPIDFLLTYKKSRILDLFSCGCGVAGCAGWHEGVCIRHGKGYVYWNLLDEQEQLDKYKIKRTYFFDKKNYDEICLKCVKLLVEMERLKITVPAYDDTDEYMHRSTLKETIKWLEECHKKCKILPHLTEEYKKQIGTD